MTRVKWFSIVALLVAVLASAFMMPKPARASEDGRKLTTLGLGAATVYFGVKHQWVPAAIAGVGTAVAYHNWQAQINARHRHDQQMALRHNYSRGYRTGYVSGSHRTRVALSRSHRTRRRY